MTDTCCCNTVIPGVTITRCLPRALDLGHCTDYAQTPTWCCQYQGEPE